MAAVFARINPVSGEIASSTPAYTVEQALEAASAAEAAFPPWASLGPGERRNRLLRAAELLDARVQDFVTLMTAETGATAGWGHFNVILAANMLREAAAMTTQIAGETIPSDVPGSMALSIRQPAGVVLGMAPWNAPVILGVRSIAMPLACGNTVVMKASESCPATHRLIGTVLHDAGLGDGVVNVVSHAPEDAPAIVKALVGHPAVRRINFTGSTAVGRIVAGLAAEQLKPVVLELGGKAPLVILKDADLDEAVKAAAFGAFANQGQICMSTDRIIIDESVADEFAEKLVKKVAGLPCGDPSRGNVVFGSVVGMPTVDRVHRLVEDAVARGAKVLLRGEARGTILPAAIVDYVTREMPIFRQETFGPCVSITRVSGVDEAVRLANDTSYGLSAAVFSRDIAAAIEVAKRIESGICHINGPTVHDEAQMPFGGMKASGYGRFGGQAAVREFTELRWITIQTTPRHYPF
jgi:vanillin dehydrogenase